MSRQRSFAFLFLLSGAAALGLQMAWTRMFAAGLGHEVPAMLGVMSAFLGGMAVGGWLLDRRLAAAVNPARSYALLEWLIGGWAILLTFLLPPLNQLALGILGATPSPPAQAAVTFLLPGLALLPATLAMGATLPAMDRVLAVLAGEDRWVGRVYALNTAGAVAGTLAATFWLMPTVGFRTSALACAGLNLLCGLAAFAWASRSPFRPPSTSAHPARNPGRNPNLNPNRNQPASQPAGGRVEPRLLLAAFMTGLLGIGFEVVGVRVLAQALENTLFTFAAALAVYLAGTAAGAALYQRFGRHRPFRPTLALLVVGLSVACLVETSVLSRLLPAYDALRFGFGDGLAGVFAAEMIMALAVFGVPTLLMGATFSHLVQAAKRADGGVGRAAAINTLGGALAGMVFGVGLLPALGAKWTLVTLALGYLASLALGPKGAGDAGAAVPPASRGRLVAAVAAVVLAGVVVLTLPADLNLLRLPPGATVRAYREGVMASVAVLQTPDGHRSLRVNNRFQMGGTAAAVAQRRQAHLPLLLHPAPRRALFLGPGTGITLGAAREHPDVVATGVELVPEVVELMPLFEPENRGPFRKWEGAGARGWGSEGMGEWGHEQSPAWPTSPPPHFLTSTLPRALAPFILCADARRFIRTTPERYDVIVADLFHPAQDGAGFLYTREHFAAVRARLADGGLFCQWLPLHQLDAPTLAVIVRTFLGVFPQTQAFLLHFNVDIPVLGLVGTVEPLRVAPDAVERGLDDPGRRAALKAAGLDRTLNLLGCAVAGPTQLSSFAAKAPLNTDDHPRVTFSAPRSALRPGIRPHEMLLDLLSHWRVEPSDLLGREPGPLHAQLADFMAARDLYLRGLATEADGRLPEAIDAYLESTRRSLYFTPAYARLVNIIQVLVATDRPAARRLFDRLEAAQPAQPLGRQMLGPLFVEP